VIVAFSDEEQVEAFGEKLTLRLDFRAITVVEQALNNTPFPTVAAYVRSGTAPFSVIGEMLWALFRAHHSEVTRDEVLAMLMDKGADGTKVGFALDALLERSFPIAEGRKSKNPPKRNGRSKSSAAAG